MSANDDYSVDKPDGRWRIESVAFIFGIVICVALFAGFGFSGRGGDVDGVYEMELDGRINPNDAVVASLERLPGIGVGRAKAIVTYRDQLGGDSGVRVFKIPRDLEGVKGIGPKTVAGLEEFVKFE